MAKVKFKRIKPITEEEGSEQQKQDNAQATQPDTQAVSPEVQNLQNQIIQLKNKEADMDKQKAEIDKQIQGLNDQINKAGGKIVESTIEGVQDLDNSDCIEDDIHPDAKSVVDSRRICYLTHKEKGDFDRVRDKVGFCYWQRTAVNEEGEEYQEISLVFSNGSHASYRLNPGHKWINAVGVENTDTTDMVDLRETLPNGLRAAEIFLKEVTDDPTEDEDGEDTYLPQRELTDDELNTIEKKENAANEFKTDIRTISSDIMRAVFEVSKRHGYKPISIHANELGTISLSIPMGDIKTNVVGFYTKVMEVANECNDLLYEMNPNAVEKFSFNEIGHSHIPTYKVENYEGGVLLLATFYYGRYCMIDLHIVTSRIFNDWKSDTSKTRVLRGKVISEFRDCFGVGAAYLAFLDAMSGKKVEWRA